MPVPRRPRSIPLLRQVRGDRLAAGPAARSERSERLAPRIAGADRVVRSVCPYCAVGCGQRVYVRDEQVIQSGGDPASPISRGRLCPKGSASRQLVTSPTRLDRVLYRRPHGTGWEELPLEQAMDMIAERFKKVRNENFIDKVELDGQQKTVNQVLAFASLCGATIDDEWNYIHQKLMRACGVVSIENQARI